MSIGHLGTMLGTEITDMDQLTMLFALKEFVRFSELHIQLKYNIILYKLFLIRLNLIIYPPP